MQKLTNATSATKSLAESHGFVKCFSDSFTAMLDPKYLDGKMEMRQALTNFFEDYAKEQAIAAQWVTAKSQLQHSQKALIESIVSEIGSLPEAVAIHSP